MIQAPAYAYYNSPQTSYKKASLNPSPAEKEKRLRFAGFAAGGIATGALLLGRRFIKAGGPQKVKQGFKTLRDFTEQKARDTAIKAPWAVKTQVDDVAEIMANRLQVDLAQGANRTVEYAGRTTVKFIADQARKTVGTTDEINNKVVDNWVGMWSRIWKATGKPMTPEENKQLRYFLQDRFGLLRKKQNTSLDNMFMGQQGRPPFQVEPESFSDVYTLGMTRFGSKGPGGTWSGNRQRLPYAPPEKDPNFRFDVEYRFPNLAMNRNSSGFSSEAESLIARFKDKNFTINYRTPGPRQNLILMLRHYQKEEPNAYKSMMYYLNQRGIRIRI